MAITETESIMIGTVGASASEIYESVLSLSRSIAGHTDLEALLSGVRESLRRIVSFDHLGLILHDPESNAMQGHILNEPGNPVSQAFECRLKRIRLGGYG
jgi:transcriptional regulator with GAF, ATPase, and Fis domain